ncbi:MAG: Mur ligase domain-containing protein [Candidatus Saccharimonadales bacterium]
MHIFFSGIGGTAIGPLALISKEAGFNVSGSDKQTSGYIDYLIKHGLSDIHIGQTRDQIANIHKDRPIDWFVYTSALTLENPNPPELTYCRDQGIKISKRDELLNFILEQKKLKLVAIAGTHGKTTTTAMVIWLFKQLGLPISYSVGAKIEFGDMGSYDQNSQYFIYEADEFDRNFLAFAPYISLISGVTWDHHEIFPTQVDYQTAFVDFIGSSQQTFIWDQDAQYLGLDSSSAKLKILDSHDPVLSNLKLVGPTNRLDGWLALKAVSAITNQPLDKLIELNNHFPGLQRRMEEIVPGLYSDYAHTPEKIRGGLGVALEIAKLKNQAVVIIYEPLTNRRQHFIIDDYKDCFTGAAKVYWLPSYLAREDPSQRIMPPAELIGRLADPALAEPAQLDNSLKKVIQKNLADGAMVVGMAGGGGSSLDEWLRREFQAG